LLLLLFLLLALAVAVYWYTSRPPYPWLFKGAFAEYKGETHILLFSVEVTLRLEVVEFNKTHAKILTYTKIKTPLETSEDQTVAWIDLTNKAYKTEESKLERVYEEERYIEGVGVRKVIVYEFKYKDTTEMMYVDKETFWPVKITIKDDRLGFKLDLNIAETNIPGLKRG